MIVGVISGTAGVRGSDGLVRSIHCAGDVAGRHKAKATNEAKAAILRITFGAPYSRRSRSLLNRDLRQIQNVQRLLLEAGPAYGRRARQGNQSGSRGYGDRIVRRESYPHPGETDPPQKSISHTGACDMTIFLARGQLTPQTRSARQSPLYGFSENTVQRKPPGMEGVLHGS